MTSLPMSRSARPFGQLDDGRHDGAAAPCDGDSLMTRSCQLWVTMLGDVVDLEVLTVAKLRLRMGSITRSERLRITRIAGRRASSAAPEAPAGARWGQTGCRRDGHRPREPAGGRRR